MMRLVIEDAVRKKFEINVGFAEIRGVRQKEKESSEISKEIVLTDSAKILCVYVHGDVEETKVTDST